MSLRRPFAIALQAWASVLVAGCAGAGSPPASTMAPVVTLEPMPERWWRLYDSAALDALIQASLDAAPDLRLAAAHVRKAQALQRESLAARFPETRTQAGAAFEDSTSGSGADRYSGGVSLAYEFDVAGRRRWDIEASAAETEAAQAAFDAARVALVAETVQAYTDACVASLQIEVVQQSIAIQQQTAERVGRRVAAGEVSGLDLALARGQLEQTHASLPLHRASRADALLRLAALGGKTPDQAGVETFACREWPELAAPVPDGDGAVLIARRPELRQQERAARAALARVGVAHADLYPRITLGLAAGAGGASPGDLGWRWSLTPLVAWSFPNRLAVQSKIEQAQADHEAALARWDRAVLLALRDVESALQRYARELDRNADLQRARDAYADAVRRAEARYRLGSEGFLSVLDSQRRLADADAQLAASRGRLYAEQIRVFVALGGGWGR